MTASRFRRILIVVLFGALAILLLMNAGGWRTRIVTRLLSVSNAPNVVPAPAGFVPRVPAGFTVSVFARGFDEPRWLAVAPNGDVFVADSAVGKVIVLRDPRRQGVAESREVFAEGLRLPFGIAFHEGYVYIANTDEVLRFPYDPASSKRLGQPEHVLRLPGLGYNQHWTRSLVFSPDGSRMFVSVGSEGNVDVEPDERRAAVLVADPDGNHMRVYAGGLRNAVGLAVSPETGRVWVSVNERDNLGDDVPQDYFTGVTEGGFYGWPYSYLGSHVDDRVPARPLLVASAIVPDVLLGGHVAPLQFAFYEAQQFPSAYRHGAFIAEHGSWNRRSRNGYRVAFVPFANGMPSGAPTSFLNGFVPDPAQKDVYGRPVGVAIASDGSLLISDDGANLIWRVHYTLESK
jgi:glucose/arabinose dehydrogenase